MAQALTLAQMRQLELDGSAAGVSYYKMMQLAGLGAVQKIQQDLIEPEERQVAALCGKGNNGGDGFVAAGLLADMGMEVRVVLTDGEPVREPALTAYREYVLDRKLPVIFLDTQPEEAAAAVSWAYGILDAIYGIGFSGVLPESVRTLLRPIQPYQRVYAMDLPSGCNGETGSAAEGTPRACRTFSFGAYKLGQFLEPCKSLCGAVQQVDIGIPKPCYPQETPLLISYEDLVHHLLDLDPRGHKGTFGRLMCVTGSRQYAGAAYLSAAAAARCGLGIVTAASTQPVLDRLFALLPEATQQPLPENDKGQIAPAALPELLELAGRCQAMLLGCGLGLSEDTEALVSGLLCSVSLPVVLDADGLNAAAKHPEIWEKRAKDLPLILTPHPAEMARLCGCSVPEVLANRTGCAREMAARTGGVVILKSDQTLITAPDGRCALLHNGANPGLGKGGSGDVLAGFAASFCAQGYEVFEAAVAAVLLHSTCGRLAAEECSERAMLPSDLLRQVGKAFLQCHQWL